ncbi:juvenile hormone esterase-like [Diorhabda sublineata]|uniref:juvenile hormone esterase-like n=1 Tax=Diorhabda sublineata TaxID=1163346 RepID=UPI0024E047BA|nr:juvenile hormone esterase-like [Diorhabda sublineata]
MKHQLGLVFFLGCAVCIAVVQPTSISELLINTPLGQIKGSVIHSRLGKQIFSFRGIRYAKPPINELRFKPPVRVEKWEGLLDATKDGPLCPQPSTEPVSEDCLSLNVYTTKLPTEGEKPKRPVIVYIPPGGFYSLGGSSAWAGPNYLLDEEVVLVTITFRVGTLGFLSLGDKEAPGNNGLKDQVEALNWVKQNIEAFGGDPNSVTLLGYGTGAWSVVLHMVSPMSQGLFHKAAALSGSPTGAWPLPTNQLELAKKQARLVGCPDDTAANIIKCLRTKPYNELGESLPKFKEFGTDPILIWSPVIEQDFGQPRFLPAHPIQLITNGQFRKIPFITGQTKDEFSNIAFNVIHNQTLTKHMNEEFEKIAPIAFLYERETDFSKTVSKTLKTYYLNDKPVDNTQLAKLTQLYSDALTGFGVNRAVKLFAEYSNSSVYYYQFNYQGRYSHFYTPESNNTVPYGIVHHDDLIYLFYIKLFPLFTETSPQEIEMVTKLTKMYANFAKTGNPIPTPSEQLDNVKWEPFTLNDQKYMDIGNKLTMFNKLNNERYSEWEKLYPLSMYQKNKHSH